MNARTTIRKSIVAVVSAALLALTVSGTAFAQDRGGVLPGVFSSGSNGFSSGVPMLNLNDPTTANLIGSFLGSFVGTMVTNNQNNDRDRNHDYYYNGDRDRPQYRDDRRTERADYPRHDERYSSYHRWNDGR
jgi:hypothetical protein